MKPNSLFVCTLTHKVIGVHSSSPCPPLQDTSTLRPLYYNNLFHYTIITIESVMKRLSWFVPLVGIVFAAWWDKLWLNRVVTFLVNYLAFTNAMRKLEPVIAPLQDVQGPFGWNATRLWTKQGWRIIMVRSCGICIFHLVGCVYTCCRHSCCHRLVDTRTRGTTAVRVKASG
jgi:hypothetical protein